MKDEKKVKGYDTVLTLLRDGLDNGMFIAGSDREEMTPENQGIYDAFCHVINLVEELARPPIRQYAWCRMTKEARKMYEETCKGSDILEDTTYTYLGEIPNMRGHCILKGQKTNKFYTGWHTDSFEEVPEDEC